MDPKMAGFVQETDMKSVSLANCILKSPQVPGEPKQREHFFKGQFRIFYGLFRHFKGQIVIPYSLRIPKHPDFLIFDQDFHKF